MALLEKEMIIREWLLVLEETEDKLKCRTKDFQIIEFNKFELREKKKNDM